MQVSTICTERPRGRRVVLYVLQGRGPRRGFLRRLTFGVDGQGGRTKSQGTTKLHPSRHSRPTKRRSSAPLNAVVHAHSATEFIMSATKSAIRTIQVKVKPNAQHSLEESASSGIWQAQIKSPLVDGKANEELVALVAKRSQCRKSAVSIKSGASGRVKLVQIEGF